MAFDVTRQEILKQANDLLRLYKQTRDQKYKDEENRLRRIVAELETITLGGGGGTQDLQDVTDLGATTTNAINTGGITTDYVQLDTAATPVLQPGMFAWNDADGTADLRLKGGNVTLQVGQETIVRVVNKTGADLLESQYKVVRVRIASEGGAQGQRLAVVLAQGDNDPDSVTTLGIVTENIANNQEGFITVFGNVNQINTTGSLQGETWVDGDVLYLSPTTPGGLTKVKPTAPNHTVTVGYVVYAHANQGKIFVKVDNGYELDELHNVLITTPSSGQLLRYNGTVWQNWTPNFLTSYTETDPTVPSHVKAITTTNISNWNTAFSWGNHAIAGYLKTRANVHTALYAAGGDTDTYAEFGIYRNYGTNGPAGTSHNTILNIMQTDGNYGVQIASLTNPAVDGLYFRDKSTSFGSWRQIATRQWVTLQNYLTANQTITLSGDVTGSGSTSIPVTLSNTSVVPGTYSNPTLTIDSKGRVTAASSGGSSLYTKTLVAYRTMLQPSGTTMNLSLDGTGATGLIGPSVPNATWNVAVDTIATVTNVIGDAPGMSIGDTYSETTRLVFKKIAGLSTLVAIVSSEAGFDASMTTALMNYSVGGTQNLNLQFQFPTFAGVGSIEINAISKLEIVEATY